MIVIESEKMCKFKVGLSGFFDIGGDLARPTASSAKSPGECCKICSEHPLCTSWNYYSAPELSTSDSFVLPAWLHEGCSLKGTAPSHRYGGNMFF